jgi:hypothetical protein
LRTAARDIMAPRRTRSAHLHRLRRATHQFTLATFRRKIDVLGRVIKGALQRKTRRG